jgi:hypothetical protein
MKTVNQTSFQKELEFFGTGRAGAFNKKRPVLLKGD